MKRLTYTLSIALMMMVSACQKGNLITTKKSTTGATNKKITVDQLLGTWKIVGNMISSGGPMYYVPASGNDKVEFKSDGTMSGSAFPDFVSYTIKTDSVTITMTKTEVADYQNYLCHIVNDTLKMSPGGPAICIEGCVVELVKE